jgi:hypothetical protein
MNQFLKLSTGGAPILIDPPAPMGIEEYGCLKKLERQYLARAPLSLQSIWIVNRYHGKIQRSDEGELLGVIWIRDCRREPFG